MLFDGVVSQPLFVDFVNSEWYDGRGELDDRLLDPRWRADFADSWHLGDVQHPSTSELRSLTALRVILRGLVEESHLGRPPSTTRLETLVSRLPAVSMRLEIQGATPTAVWKTVRPSWTSVQAEIIQSCYDFLAGAGRDRLRRCDNDGCRWAFVDASRNRSRRWCDPAACGNVSKVRAYRERHRLSRSRTT